MQTNTTYATHKLYCGCQLFGFEPLHRFVHFPFTELVKMPVSEEKKKGLNDNRVALVERMNLDILWPYLHQMGAMSVAMQEQIQVCLAQCIRSAKTHNTDEQELLIHIHICPICPCFRGREHQEIKYIHS